MKTYEKVMEPARERLRLKERTCDLCGTKAKHEITGDWGAGCYEVSETELTVEVRRKVGESYPEGGSGKEIEVDLCPKCFMEKLVPWLRSQGAKIEEKDWDW